MRVTDRPSFLRRALGTTALYVVGIPMIVIGMLLVFSIVAYDTVRRRFRKPPTLAHLAAPHSKLIAAGQDAP
jgi:hypothetical protein